MRPRSYNTFWEIIKKSKVKFKRVKTPYSCVIHEKAPGYRRRKAEVEDLLASINAPAEHTTERAELLKELNKLTKKVAKCEIHERMFENQRRFIQDKEKDLLKYPRKASGENKVIVYEDFADFYNADGKKILNLVLTIVWCDENGKLQRKYIDNLNSDHIRAHNPEWKEKFGKFGSNVMFVKRVWEFLLRPNEIRTQLKNEAMSADKKQELLTELAKHVSEFGDEFEGVTDILRTGDSGPHFHNKVNMFFESSAFKRYGIKWECHTVCKRHAYSLCDAHGGACKRAFRHASVIGELPKEAADFARAIIAHAKFGDTRAIAYSHMDMSTKDLEYAALANMDGMQAACEFQYYYIDDNGEKVYTDGFVRFRVVSGDDSAPWNAYYLPRVEAGESKKLCKKCTQGLQRPVWHEKSKGNCTVKWTQAGDKRVLMPALREKGGEKIKMEAMKVVDMCEWARLEGMANLEDAIRNTVLDGVRLTVIMSSPEEDGVRLNMEELFTQMGLDASKKAFFQAQLDKLRTHGWTRPSTKQVMQAKKVAQKEGEKAAPRTKRKNKSKVEQKTILVVAPQEPAPQPASAAVGDTPVSTSQVAAMVADVPQKENRSRKREPKCPDGDVLPSPPKSDWLGLGLKVSRVKSQFLSDEVQGQR